MIYASYKATGIRIEVHNDGSITFDYGGSLGSKTFKNLRELQTEIPDWIDAQRNRLIRQAAELEEVEKAVQRMYLKK
jgi:hypothetical protein